MNVLNKLKSIVTVEEQALWLPCNVLNKKWVILRNQTALTTNLSRKSNRINYVVQKAG